MTGERDDTGIDLRAYDPETDREALWSLKRGFELELGAGTGDDGKVERYEGKLTDAYRERYLGWVERCVASDPYCVTVAEVADADSRDADSRDADSHDDDSRDADEPSLAGYVFVLPWDLAMIWDAAVLNEIYVPEPRRGTGVADALMDAAVELARDQDPPLPRLVLDVDRGNDRARAFYDRHGFEHWGEMVAREL